MRHALAFRDGLAAVRRGGWLAAVLLAVIVAAGHLPAAQHCQTVAAISVVWTSAEPTAADAEEPASPPSCCANSVEVGQRWTCTASGDVAVAACQPAAAATATGKALSSQGRFMPLTQAQLQRWRH
jgi:hypothetical protein